MNYYQNLFINLPFPCLLLEKREDVFVIKEANRLYHSVTKGSGEEMSGKAIEEIFPKNPFSSGLSQIQESLKTAYNNKEVHKIEVLRLDLYNAQKGNCDLNYWEMENIPIFDESENIWYILNVIKDITAEILEKDRSSRIQTRLDDKAEKHEHFIERISDGLFSLDFEGNFVSLNKGLADIAETPEIELLKMNFLPFFGSLRNLT